jgi:predicted phage tail component-like protein
MAEKQNQVIPRKHAFSPIDDFHIYFGGEPKDRKEIKNDIKVKADATELTEVIEVLKGLSRPMMPEMAMDTEAFPGQDGSRFYSSRFTERKITIPYILRVDPNQDRIKYHEQLMSQRKALAKILNTRVPKVLIFSDEPERYYVAMPTGGFDVDENNWKATGTLEFTCYDPFRYGDITTAGQNVVHNGTYHNGEGIGIQGSSYGTKRPGYDSFVVTNGGDFKVPITVDFVCETDLKFLQFHATHANGTTQTWQFGVTPDSSYAVPIKRSYTIYPDVAAKRIDKSGTIKELTTFEDHERVNATWTTRRAFVPVGGNQLSGTKETLVPCNSVGTDIDNKYVIDARSGCNPFYDYKNVLGIHTNINGKGGGQVFITGYFHYNNESNNKCMYVGTYGPHPVPYLAKTDKKKGTYIRITQKTGKNAKTVRAQGKELYGGWYIEYDKNGTKKGYNGETQHWVKKTNGHYSNVAGWWDMMMVRIPEGWKYGAGPASYKYTNPKTKKTHDIMAYYQPDNRRNGAGYTGYGDDGKLGERVGSRWAGGWVGSCLSHKLHGYVSKDGSIIDEDPYMRDFEITYTIGMKPGKTHKAINSCTILGPSGGKILNITFEKIDTKKEQLNLYATTINQPTGNVLNIIGEPKLWASQIKVKIIRIGSTITVSVDTDAGLSVASSVQLATNSVSERVMFYMGTSYGDKPGSAKSNDNKIERDGIDTKIAKAKKSLAAVKKKSTAKTIKKNGKTVKNTYTKDKQTADIKKWDDKITELQARKTDISSLEANNLKDFHAISLNEDEKISLPDVLKAGKRYVIDGANGKCFETSDGKTGTPIWDIVDIGSEILMAEPGDTGGTEVTFNIDDKQGHKPPTVLASIQEKYL